MAVILDIILDYLARPNFMTVFTSSLKTGLDNKRQAEAYLSHSPKSTMGMYNIKLY